MVVILPVPRHSRFIATYKGKIMSWQGQMGTIVRYLIDDVDPDNYKYSDHRIETTVLVAGQLTQMNVDFGQSYNINVENCTLSPDPTDPDNEDKAFITLICLRAACIIVGSAIRSESGNAISIKDGPSAIDLRGVTQTLTVLYKDLCDKFDQQLLEYRAGNSIGGQAILGPYSPGSDYISRNYFGGHRAGGYFEY
jgi:hypothetical protein